MNFATLGPLGPMSRDVSLIFACESNTGSSIFTDMAATMPPLMSEYSKFLPKCSLIVLDSASRKAVRWGAALRGVLAVDK